MENKILVTGATGTIGRELVKQLSAKGIQFRALVRTPEKVDLIKTPEVEIFIGDFAKPETLVKPLEGVERAFFLSNATLDQVKLHSNFLKAAKDAGVKYIVKLSAMGTGPEATEYVLKWHWQTETEIKDLGMNYTFLHPAYFMQNILWNASTVKSENAIYAPFGEGKIGMVDVRDIAAVAAAAANLDALAM